jgi:hypothetical protein
MKRILSILLLMILLLAAVQPTLVFHYCGKTLHSIALGQDHSKHTCDGSCCSDYKVTIATDDFQVARQAGIEIPSLALSPIFFVLSGDVLHGYDLTASHSIQHIFPPGGFVKHCADILSLICIFRI